MWDSILEGAAWLLSVLANLVGDWGLAIIIVTLVIRLILFPVQRKQVKSTMGMQDMQPKIKRIQELYEGDQQKIQEETMKIYQETGFNPAAGCLPLLIQMPIFIILFQTLRYKLPEGCSFYNILPDLSITIQQSDFNIVYVIFGLCFIGFSVVPMVQQYFQANDPQTKSTNLMMSVVMGIMFVWMAWISPAGVILYWSLSSAFGLVQNILTKRHVNAEKEKAREEEELIRKPIEVNVQRKVKKKRPHKSR